MLCSVTNGLWISSVFDNPPNNKQKLWENKKYTFLKSMSVSILSQQTSDFLPNKDKTGVDPTWHAI